MAHGETYEEFVDKFKPKLTTDDCYTPDNIYYAVANWVAKRYSLNRSTFVRPFYPGGDYQAEDYSGKVVVDNPPFSIIKKNSAVVHGTRNQILSFRAFVDDILKPGYCDMLWC